VKFRLAHTQMSFTRTKESRYLGSLIECMTHEKYEPISLREGDDLPPHTVPLAAGNNKQQQFAMRTHLERRCTVGGVLFWSHKSNT
jgi:hypothetical protein